MTIQSIQCSSNKEHNRIERNTKKSDEDTKRDRAQTQKTQTTI